MAEFPPEEVSASDVQTQPYSRQAEEAVLGAVLIDPEAYFNVSQFLHAEDFYIERNRWIWMAFLHLHESRVPIDYLTVCEYLEQQNQLAEVGGQAYLLALINQTPSALNVEAYGHTVEDNGLRRRMLQAANDLARLAYDQKRTVDTVIDEAEKTIFSISEKRVRHDLQPIQQVLSEVYDRVDQLSQRGEEIMGVPTGLIDLDKLFGGLQKSDLLIVAGRPGMGKTGFMLSVLKNAAQRYKKHVAMFSLEMSNEQLVQRLIAQETGIDTQRLRTGKLTEEEWPLFTHAMEVLAGTHVFLDDTPAITPMQLRTKCRRLHMEYELDLIIIDYLQLMSSETRNDNRVQEVSYISRNLKVLARELNVPVLTAAQLSRAVEQRADKRPVLSDLRESGCLTGDALVALASGGCAAIADLVGQTPEVVCLGDDLRITTARASKVWHTGHRPVYKLTTRSGRVIRATSNHPFRVLTGWKALDDLEPGERIGLPRAYPESKPQTIWSDESVILLAHLIGDGCYAPRQPIHYTSASERNLAAVSQAALAEFGISARRVYQESWSHVYLSAGANKWHPSPVRQWLDDLGIYGQRSYEKVIPAPVFTLPADQIRLFLRHLWATDGSIYLRKTTHGQTGTIYYSTSSEALAKQVQYLLARFGIPSRVKPVQKGLYRPNYHVSVSGKENQLRYACEIGAIGDRQDALDILTKFYEPILANANLDTIPLEVWQMVKASMREQGISQRQMAALRGTSYGGDAHFGFAPTRETLTSYATILAQPELREIVEADIYWDFIESIVPDGEADVYDMTVPGAHNFVANGILVHNSLEQDADIVMFIHRPDAMEKDSPKSNLAEIIVAKHRNGPTHSGIELVFLNNLARFDNAAPAPGRR
jgi:replicative DNA helicase